MNDPLTSRYPIKDKSKYFESVGKLLPHRIGQILEEIGFRTQVNPVQSNGVDLKVFNEKNELLLVAEILNWSVKSEMCDKRIQSIINNLSAYNCERVLIYTSMKYEHILDNVTEVGISIIKLKHQIQPKLFFNFFKAKNQINSRTIDSRKARLGIKNKLLEHLESIDLKPLSPKPNQEVDNVIFRIDCLDAPDNKV